MTRWALLAITVWLSAAFVEAQEVDGAVFRVAGQGCRGRDLIQSGFVATVDGEAGIVTTLHGVVGCSSVVAESSRWRAGGLEISRVDIRRDMAFLTGEALRTIRVGPWPPGTRALANVEKVGLRSLVPDDALAAIEDRRSPSPRILVFERTTTEGPPDFGAPVIDMAGSVVGVENGVHAARGPVAWVVPYRDIQWTPPVQNETEMDRLATLSTAPLW